MEKTDLVLDFYQYVKEMDCEFCAVGKMSPTDDKGVIGIPATKG